MADTSWLLARLMPEWEDESAGVSRERLLSYSTKLTTKERKESDSRATWQVSSDLSGYKCACALFAPSAVCVSPNDLVLYTRAFNNVHKSRLTRILTVIGATLAPRQVSGVPAVAVSTGTYVFGTRLGA